MRMWQLIETWRPKTFQRKTFENVVKTNVLTVRILHITKCTTFSVGLSIEKWIDNSCTSSSASSDDHCCDLWCLFVTPIVDCTMVALHVERDFEWTRDWFAYLPFHVLHSWREWSRVTPVSVAMSWTCGTTSRHRAWSATTCVSETTPSPAVGTGGWSSSTVSCFFLYFWVLWDFDQMKGFWLLSL